LSFFKEKRLELKNFLPQSCFFFNTNQISAEKQAHFFEETNPYYSNKVPSGLFDDESRIIKFSFSHFDLEFA
jgi:hypothetical protein